MESITLKNSDLWVSRLCMGGCPMGRYGWGKVFEEELIEAVHTALDIGVTFFDTADTYGLGQSEITLGKALGSRRKSVTIATKFGVRVLNKKTCYDNRPFWIREALAGSLRRIGTDYIDLFQVHYRDGITPIGEVVETLEQLKREGKIRYYGLSNIGSRDAAELGPYKGRFVSFQNEYSLACRKHEKTMLDLSESLEMTPLTWGSLGQGVLTGKYTVENAVFGSDDRRSRPVYVNFHGEKLKRNLLIVEQLRQIAAAHDKPVSAVAIRFILDHLPGSVVLCGAKRPNQVIANAQGMDWHLTEEEIRALEIISKTE